MMSLIKFALIILGVIGMYFVMMASYFLIEFGDKVYYNDSELAVTCYLLAFVIHILASIYWFALGRIKKRNLPRFK